jgi:hypothetical protein
MHCCQSVVYFSPFGAGSYFGNLQVLFVDLKVSGKFPFAGLL